MAEIAAEQVERAIGAAERCDARGVNAALGAFWYEREDIPADVRDGWRQVGYLGLRAALTRWRDSLPVSKVARWDAERGVYALSPGHPLPHGAGHCMEASLAMARDWGYTIEGGPAPVDDTAPERLRERREALGWTTAYAGHWVPWFDHTDVERAESGKGIPAFVARYAAALSAAEAERAVKPMPGPEVVDVPQEPQPTAKRCGEVLAKVWPGQDIMHIEVDGGGYVRAPVALLRDMLAAIDAQQPAPVTEPARPDPVRPDAGLERPEPRYKVGDWVRVTYPTGTHRGEVYQVAEVTGNYCRRTAGSGACSYLPDWLTPALDPALHETARKTVAALRSLATRPLKVLPLPDGYMDLPGALEWVADSSKDASPRWAAQIESLLGDAP